MKISFFIAGIFFCVSASAQTKNLAEKLGYPKDAKLLIIHADDAGFSHSADSAIESALNKGAVNSAAIMVACPWFPEIAAFAKQHPEMDWGIHLSLTAEWKNYKWGSVAPADQVPTLLNPDGYFYDTNGAFQRKAKVSEAEKEIRAQIDKAKAFGIRITHIDNHMGSILTSADMIKMYQRVGKEYHLPVLIPMNMLKLLARQTLPMVDTTGVLVDNYIIALSYSAADKWGNYYNYQLQHLKPGLNELIFHLGFNDDELKAVTTGHLDYGAAWRQQDYDYATSDEFKALLKQQGVYLVTWGQIKKAEYGD